MTWLWCPFGSHAWTQAGGDTSLYNLDPLPERLPVQCCAAHRDRSLLNPRIQAERVEQDRLGHPLTEDERKAIS